MQMQKKEFLPFYHVWIVESTPQERSRGQVELNMWQFQYNSSRQKKIEVSALLELPFHMASAGATTIFDSNAVKCSPGSSKKIQFQ